MSTVSIILPTYNRATTLNRAVVSVLEQTFQDFELIVVDDASDDDTFELVQSFDDKRIKYLLLSERSGAGGARNAGIRMATSEFIAFQDSDDQWLPEKLETQMSAMSSACDKVGIVYCDMLRILESGQESLMPAPKSLPNSIINQTTSEYCHQDIGIVACLIRRDCLLNAGLFNESLPAFEDLELFMRLSEQCEFRHVPKALVRYYETQGVSSDRKVLATARRMILALNKDKLAGEKRVVAKELINIARFEYEGKHGQKA